MKPCCIGASVARGDEPLGLRAVKSQQFRWCARSQSINGNTDGHVIADYPARTRLRFTEAVSVLLKTYQSGTNAPL